MQFSAQPSPRRMAGAGSAIGVGHRGSGRFRLGFGRAVPVRQGADSAAAARTQGIYGLLIAFITLSQVGVLGGDPNISVYKGLMYFAACMPMAIAGLFSAIAQGKTSVASIAMVTKRPDQAGKAIIFPVMVETYAILALLISILAITGVGSL